MASSSNRGHDEGPEEEQKIPRTGQARRLAWEPEHVPSVIDASQPSSTLEGQVLHHLVQEEHLGPTVAELEDPRQRRLAPETQGGPASWLEPVQELLQTPVQELRPVSPASAPAEPENIPAEASVPRQGPKLESQEPSGLMVPGLAEPEPCPDPMSPWDIPGVVSAPVPGSELEPHEPLGLGPMAPAGMAPGLAEPEADPEPTSACVAITPDVPRTEERTILQFPAHLVAEQLTLMCAELYSRIEYVQCKAYLESQPLMEGTELLAPNVQMVIRQFDAMVSLVISSCLGTVTMTAQDRAQVVQFWIRVAEECLALKNFAALRAILLALQSRPIGRLESTWGRVSWKSSRTYKKLKKRDEEANREWLLKEARAIVKQKRWAPRGCQYRKKQGMVPFLGLFLRDVPIDQLPENNDVTVILHEMMIYKYVARLYDLEPEERFVSFAQAVEPRDEEER
ncbi:ral-GDS-related protein-like [Manis pentadactyla]|uniref:ral-GDS-related protein-like n=1 Tax=Manis pentadactyla TaxID=143292 RepID=UPI00255C4669|nr:ral-GDS-related protein-like [Manis pentadactyla]